jgi:aarF domain-containing kinase
MKLSQAVPIICLCLGTGDAFQSLHNVQTIPERLSTTKVYSSVSETSAMMKEMREKMDENEDARLMMQALRGQGLNDDDTAVAGLEMKLVGIDSDPNDTLPFEYDALALKAFFGKRPMSVLTRIAQVASVGGIVFLNTSLDALFGRLKNNPDLEVQRAGELRDIITSLGPFFIKIGQALSIRPDILSPRSMVELQKLCDKVPCFDSKIAFATIEEELGRTIEDLFSEITPEPVAAASLGQVYKAVLRDTGETVAVKVQRPAVLETVSLDLYLARELGLLARNFPALADRLDAGMKRLAIFVSSFYKREFSYVFCLQWSCWTSSPFDSTKSSITSWNVKMEYALRKI